MDNNVTRNLNIELEKKDWSVMVLHYLGLDHIGHVYGPFSPLIKPKLQEMDKIIGRIYSYVSEMVNFSDLFFKFQLKFQLIIEKILISTILEQKR